MEAYILQVILFQLLFLLVYELLLKKETFFTYNRLYLLFTSLVSFLLPLIKVDALAFLIPAETFTGITNVWLPEVFIGQEKENIQNSLVAQNSDSPILINWWLFTYFVGIFVSLIIVFKKYRNLNKLFSFKTISSEDGIRIIEVPNSGIACTFYNTVFLGERLTETERLQILTHELVHVKQKHSLDLVFFEVLKIIFWFNPLIYIYQNKIATLHEFIADAAVVKVTEKRSYYEQLLNNAFNTQNISFINQFFNHSLIKKRIVMIQKTKSKTIAKIKYLALVPLMLIMLSIVACSEEKSPETEAISQIEERTLYIRIENFENQTAEEKEKINVAIEGMKNRAGYDYVHIFDGKKTIVMSNDSDTGQPKIVTENIHGNLPDQRITEQYQNSDVPFAVVDQVPVFPGCENFGNNEEQKKCLTEKVTEYVSANFNTSLGKKLGLTGENRIIVVFKISSEGNITDIRSRAPHPDLEVEAERVMEGLPQMIAGKHNGQDVGVSYSLPIVFQVNE